MKKIILLLPIIVILTSCSFLGGLIPDKRDEYKKSEASVPLEVPPDLTADAINDSMAVPGEGISATKSQYNLRRARGGPQGSAMAPGLETLDEQWVSVRGSAPEIWPKLRAFFTSKGYSVDLDDAELGVLVTDWSASEYQGGLVYRNKFKVFSEAGGAENMTVLFISNLRQERISQEGGESEWIDQGNSLEAEKQLAGELNLYFNGTSQAGPAGGPVGAASAKQAELISAGEGKKYLLIPEEFASAWMMTGIALERVGFTVDDKSQTEGLYFITYFDPVATKKKGLLSKLAFWKGDETEGRRYRISLTGVGEKTELVVLNPQGEWREDPDADRILDLIQQQINRSLGS